MLQNVLVDLKLPNLLLKPTLFFKVKPYRRSYAKPEWEMGELSLCAVVPGIREAFL